MGERGEGWGAWRSVGRGKCAQDILYERRNMQGEGAVASVLFHAAPELRLRN